MKKLYFILFFLISSSLSYGQKIFDNGDADGDGVKDNNRGSAGDFLWSNADNWSNGIPNAGNTQTSNARVTLKATKLIIDRNVWVGLITKADHAIGGSSYNTEIV